MWKLLKAMPDSQSETRPEFASEETPGREVLRRELFLQMLARERKRTERSRRCFVLMLLDCESLFRSVNKSEAFNSIISALFTSTRETDITGWYKDGSVIGVIFTEIGDATGGAVVTALLNKVTNALAGTLTIGQINELSLSFHVYPEKSDDQDHPPAPTDAALYPDVHLIGNSTKTYRWFKRAIDISGSLLAIALSAPALLLIAILIKLTSKGPILFKQQRRGHYGKTFTFLKFRSMYVDNDHTIHKEYVKQFIKAQVGNGHNRQNGKPAVYKLTGDPRITRIGRILRRTSLDELPQFFNVLLGDMSLVGPRPPIPYEFGAYDIWHRRRLLDVKPGITGLWQVQGRSRVTFDEMVRLDLRYANARSIWLDIKILLQTPRAVVTGAGAY